MKKNLLIILTLTSIYLFADIQIGNGNCHYLNLPFQPNQNYSYSQTIYLQSEIMIPGEITGIEFQYLTTGPVIPENLTVYIGNTDKTEYTSWDNWIPIGELTQVFSGTINVEETDNGWLQIIFDYPYYYNNEDNLVIAVDENEPSTNGNLQFYNSNTNRRSILFSHFEINPDPSQPPCGMPNPPTIKYGIANIKLLGIGNNEAPTIPSEPIPADNSEMVNLTPTLQWNSNLAEYYDVFLNDELVANNILEPIYTIEQPLDYDSTYNWQVIASNEFGNTNGPVWQFSTMPALPTIPENPYPTNNSTYTLTQPNLSWNCVLADSYDIYIDGELIAANYENNNYTVGSPLAQGETHSWQINANNDNGTTEGQVWYFTVHPSGLEESFEEEIFPPEGWQVYNEPHETGWFQSGGAYVGVKSAYKADSSYSQLCTPLLNISELDTLAFYAQTNCPDAVPMQIKYSATKEEWFDLCEVSIPTEYEKIKIPLSSISGPNFLGFCQIESNSTQPINLDGIMLPLEYQATHDVGILNISYTNEDYYQGDSFPIEIILQNNGIETETDISLCFYVNENPIKTIEVPELNAGENTIVSTNWTVDTNYGWQTLKAELNLDDEIMFNNSFSKNIQTYEEYQLVEHFENSTFPPVSWNATPTDWYPINWVWNEDIISPSAVIYHDSQGRLVTPKVNITNRDSLTFNARACIYGGDVYGDFMIQYSSDGVNWEDLEFIELNEYNDRYAVDLSAATGAKYLGFYKYNWGAVWVDNVTGPLCIAENKDIRIEKITFNKEEPHYVNNPVELKIDITNNSLSNATNTQFNLLVDNQIYDTFELDTLNPGELETQVYTWTASAEPLYHKLAVEYSSEDDFPINNSQSTTIDIMNENMVFESFEENILPPGEWMVDNAPWGIETNPFHQMAGEQCLFSHQEANGRLISPKLEYSQGDSLIFYAKKYYWQEPLIKIEYSHDLIEWHNLTYVMPYDLWTRYSIDISDVEPTYLGFTRTEYGALFVDNICGFTKYTGNVNNKEDEACSIKTELYQNKPNPFNPTTKISFQLAKDSDVKIKIYNIKGKLVKTLVNGSLPKGKHNLIWNGKNNQHKKVSSGIYFYKLITPNKTTTRKMLMLK